MQPAGCGSFKRTPMRRRSPLAVAAGLTSSVEGAFTIAHQALIDAVADLLVLAFQNAAILERETLRRERIDSLRGLLHTMAESLDLRSVSERRCPSWSLLFAVAMRTSMSTRSLTREGRFAVRSRSTDQRNNCEPDNC